MGVHFVRAAVPGGPARQRVLAGYGCDDILRRCDYTQASSTRIKMLSHIAASGWKRR